MKLVPYEQAQKQIKEADVLLFRGEGLMSWLIKRYGGGAHSHAAMAHWDDDDLQCVEFREFKGGRAVSMKSQVETHPDNIDVFRAADLIRIGDSKYNLDYGKDSVSERIGDTMKEITGLDYGWKNFWKLAKHYAPFCRLAEQNMKDEEPNEVFVCSTAVTYAYRKNYLDPTPYLADSATTPADLARSALFSYQFTIQKDW
jgi:hypothetical protein